MAPRFTTIRSWNQEKEGYYTSLIGQKFQVWKTRERYPFYREYVVCHAYLASVEAMYPIAIDGSILEADVMLNGVPDQEWIAKIRKMNKVILLTFSRNPEPLQKSLDVMK